MFSLHSFSGFILLAFAIILQCQRAVGHLHAPVLLEHQLHAPAVLLEHGPSVVVHHDHDEPPHLGYLPLHSSPFSYLRPFLHPYLDSHQRTLELIEREHQLHEKLDRGSKRTCWESHKFKGCCNQIGMTSAITDIPGLINDACKYPPANLARNQKITLGFYFNEYVMCYADAQDNKKCCADAGVPSEVSYAFWTVNCQNLCYGRNPQLSANAAWDECSPYKEQISKCNMKHVDMNARSGAETYGYCNNPSWCKKAFGWKDACPHAGK